MSLLEQVAQTRQQILDLQALKKRADHAAEFEQRANTLMDIAGSLAPLCVPAAVLREVGIDVPDLDRALLAALHARAAELVASYASDRSSILAPFPGQDFKHVFLVPCNSIRQKTDSALKQAWSEWVHGKMPAIDQEVLSVLFGVTALSQTVASIRALLGEVVRYAGVLPHSVDDVNKVLALCSDADRAWRELAGDGVAPDVLAFLRAAGGGGGAPYDLLTPSILAWLDAHHLRRVLRIRLG